MSFDFEFEKFFPKNHPESIAFLAHKDQFGYDNDYLQIILEPKGGIFNQAFIAKATSFEHSLKQIDDIENIYSAFSLKHFIKTPTGVVFYPLIHKETPEKLANDSIRIFNNAFYRSSFSASRSAVSIYIKHAHFNDPDRGMRIISGIRRLAVENDIHSIRLVGKITASNVFLSYMRADFGKFLVGGIVISLVSLLLIFRNFKDSILPFLVGLLSIVWTFGAMGWFGFKINLLSSLIPPILLFISMSDAIHLINGIRNQKDNIKFKRILSAISKVWSPTLLTSVTTAIGFLSLLWINTEPIQHLGIFASIGIVFAFIITYTLGIAFYMIFSISNKKGLLLQWNFTAIISHRKQFVTGIGILLVMLVPGISKIKVNAELLEDLPESESIRHDFEYVDQSFGGSKPYEVRLVPADSSKRIWNKEVMDEIHKIHVYLEDSFELARINDPTTIINYIHQVNNGGLNEYYSYPSDDQSYQKTLQLKQRIDPKRLSEIVTEDGKVGRIIGFIPELGSHETIKKNRKLLSYLDQHINHKVLTYNLTGTTYLIDKSHELLSTNLIKGLLTAIGIIGLLLGLYFKSWRLLIISLVPNIIPLLMIGGVMGWSEIDLKLTTAIIFTVAFGIAVDDTIHFISSYLKSNEPDPYKRMKDTYLHAGRAIVITTASLLAGFSLFLFSSFGATFYMGLFVCLSLAIAVLIDLTLLPTLLHYYYTKHVTKRRTNP